MGGKLHLRLNIGERPIANKYREGKMKRTLKRELKVPEIAKREANEPSHFVGETPVPGCVCVVACVSVKAHFCRTGVLGSIQSLQQVSTSVLVVLEILGKVGPLLASDCYSPWLCHFWD